MTDFATPIELYRALRTAWCPETSNGWSADNPAKNHCSVTALVAQDIFGGELLRTPTVGGTHFYNMIDGVRWDLTVSQFAEPIPFQDLPTAREQAMADAGEKAYRTLRRRLGLPEA